MANKYPIYLNNIKFYVNPVNIIVKKVSQVASVKTKAGVVFQEWPDLPDTVSLKGSSYGRTAFSELKMLKEKFHNMAFTGSKFIILRYKGENYDGYLKTLNITGTAEIPGKFDYDFEFQCINPPHFKIEDLTIGSIQTENLIFGSLAQLQRTWNELTILQPFSGINNIIEQFNKKPEERGNEPAA